MVRASEGSVLSCLVPCTWVGPCGGRSRLERTVTHSMANRKQEVAASSQEESVPKDNHAPCDTSSQSS